MGSPDDQKIHMGFFGSLIGMGGNELLVKLARHLTYGYRKNDERIVKILKSSVIHFVISTDPQAESGNSLTNLFVQQH